MEQHRNSEIDVCHKYMFFYCSGHPTGKTNQTKYISQWQNLHSDAIENAELAKGLSKFKSTKFLRA